MEAASEIATDCDKSQFYCDKPKFGGKAMLPIKKIEKI